MKPLSKGLLNSSPMFLFALGMILTSFCFAEEQVTIDGGQILGRASQIGDFLGAAGRLYPKAYDPNDPIVQAWRAVGFKNIAVEVLHVESPQDRWVVVTRNKEEEFQIDFKQYDQTLEQYRKNLGARPFVCLGKIPRVLSSRSGDDWYFVYQPKDLREWQEFVSEVVRHHVDLGLRGLYYGCPGLPDHPDSWRGSGSGNRAETLLEHIMLYAATYRGVKAVDPSAKVGGPATLAWQETGRTPNPECTLKEWIQTLAAYNAQMGTDGAVGLDYISWADYGWSSQRLSDGAAAVSRFLEENGFDPATPKVLAGSGKGSWSSDDGDEAVTADQRASHLVYNIVREFQDPTQREFALALYHSFYFLDLGQSEEPDAETVQRVALVQTLKNGRTEYTPMYAAFQMVSAMTRGEILKSQTSGELEAMASWDSPAGKVRALINNHSVDSTQAVVVFNNLRFGGDKVEVQIQRVDSSHSADGRGLESGILEEAFLNNGSVRMEVELPPYSSMQVILTQKKNQ